MSNIEHNKNNDTLEDIVFNHFDNAEELRYVTMDSYDMSIGMYSQPVVTESSSEIIDTINETTPSTSTNPSQLNITFLSNQSVGTNASDKLASIVNEAVGPSNQSEIILNNERLFSNDVACAPSPVILEFYNSQPTAASSNVATNQMLNNMVGTFRNR